MLRTVLVVDDSRLIQHMLQLLLSRFRGVRVLPASDGAEALDLLGREPEIDLVLLDINMPVMNGLELLARVRNEPAYKRIPIVMVTTHGDEVSARRCLDMGASGYVTKPVNGPELYKLIESLTGDQPSER